MKKLRFLNIFAIVAILCCFVACSSDNDSGDNGSGEEPVNETSFSQPETEGWNDLGTTCYVVYPQSDDNRIEKSHYKWNFSSSSDTAKCISGVYELLCVSAKAAIGVQHDLSADNPTIKEKRIVVCDCNSYIGMTKAKIRQTMGYSAPSTPTEKPTEKPKPTLDSTFMIGKWVLSYSDMSLDGEETELIEERFRTLRWEFKADGTAIWSYRNWSDKWQMFDPWQESPDKYTWSLNTYNGNVHVFVLTRHEGKKWFSDYKETNIRRYIKNWSDDSFFWKNDDNERLDGKPYHVAEGYFREK